MNKKSGLFIITAMVLSLWVTACSKAGEKGASKKTGSGKVDLGLQGKVANEDILDKNMATFESCLNKKIEDLLTIEGFAKNTLVGKNLENVLKHLTGQSNLKLALDELDKSRKDLNVAIRDRFNLSVSIVEIYSDLKIDEKFLLYENTFETVFSFDKILTNDEAKEISKKLEQLGTGFFENDRLVHELINLTTLIKSADVGASSADASKKELQDKIKSYVPNQRDKIEDKKTRVKAISERISKKDKNLKFDNDSVVKELLTLSGTLEMKACSQMAIQKTEKKGDVLISYLQAMKAMIDLGGVTKLK